MKGFNMSTNMNAGQQRLYTFAEMSYTTQAPQGGTPGAAQTPVAPESQEPQKAPKGDTVTIFGKEVSKKKAGIGAAITAAAVLVLATLGLAHSGKKINGADAKFLQNVTTGLGNVWHKITSFPGKVADFFRKEEVLDDFEDDFFDDDLAGDIGSAAGDVLEGLGDAAARAASELAE